MTTYLRPPSVAEYARMTKALRLDAAIAVVTARAAGAPTERPWAPDDVASHARALLRDVAHRWPDPPHVQRARREAAAAEAAAWVDTRRHTRGRRTAR